MSGDGFASPGSSPPDFAAMPPLEVMIQITRSKPCYYLTSVAHDRLPVFRLDLIKQIVCDAWCEARKSGEILIFAYVIMPDHSHVVTDGHREIISKRMILKVH